MPELVLENIIGFSDFRSVLTLRQVCRDFRNFIDDLNDSKLPDSKFTKIEIISEKNENKIILDFFHSKKSFDCIEYSEMENSRKFQEKMTNLENSNIVDVVIQDLKLILKFQKSNLEFLSFCFADFQLQKDSSIHNLPIKLRNILHESNQKIKAKKFTIKAHNQSQIMSVPPFADPETLEFIDLHSFDDDKKIQYDEIIKTEQWKKAQMFRSEFHLLNLNVEDICHFSPCILTTNRITARDLDFLKKTYIRSSKFNFSIFELKNFNENDEISNLWGPAFSVESKLHWYFRMKNCEEKILHMEIFLARYFKCYIIEMNHVHNGAIVHDYNEN
ncbi:hypothetical protein B9Z55_021270 [Caenorhabditis nigoni]|nr:hypothetical protein B9Z55_021270 [Caenorhabditis nigoni]